jgi:hypothetical protein
MGLQDPARPAFRGGIDYQGFAVVAALVMLVVPFYAIKVLFAIERKQIEAHHRIRSRAL